MGRRRRRTGNSRRRHTPGTGPVGAIDITRRGYAFVDTDEGSFFVPARRTNGAMPGDTVELAVSRNYGSSTGGSSRGDSSEGAGGSGERKRTASVARVIERASDRIVGVLELNDPLAVVVAQDPRIRHDLFVDDRRMLKGARDGDVVIARITTWPTRREAMRGYIEEIIGSADEPGLDIDIIVGTAGLETAFSDAALAEAASIISGEADIEAALAEDGRRDLRDRLVFTIDPEDAKDFDDALSIERLDAAAGSGGAAGPGSAASAEGAAGPGAGSGSVANSGGAAGAEWRLGVHIADVSSYVACGGAIDSDARKRTTSAYLADRVLPMLPERLSNDVCSLRPGEDRRAMTCDVYLDERLRVVGHEIFPSVIRSCRRYTYGEVQEILDAGRKSGAPPNLWQESHFVHPQNMWQESHFVRRASAAPPDEQNAIPATGGGECREPGTRRSILWDEQNAISATGWGETQITGRAAGGRDEKLYAALAVLSRIAKSRITDREKRGALDFDFPEAKVVLDEDGHVTRVDLRRKTEATSLVEEAMILANETVAAHLRDAGRPCVYRVHDEPSAASIDSLGSAVAKLGYDARGIGDGAVALQQLLAKSAGKMDGPLVQVLVLKSMERARYSTENIGHYGLASGCYCHFTSPIRRYPDLMVHRLLRDGSAMSGELEDLAAVSSKMERVVEEAEDDSVAVKLCEWLAGKVGEEMDGTVSRVQRGNIGVRLECTIEGIVRLGRSSGSGRGGGSRSGGSGGGWRFDAERQMLKSEESGRVIRLGQRLRVRISDVRVSERAVELELAE